MEYKVLYRKYRPDCFKNIVGQEYTIKMLQNSIKYDKISHAYLFTGPRGTGKTSTAKVFAKTINCLNIQNGEACGECINCKLFEHSPDVIEIDAASNNGVDDIRELINNVKIAPTESKYKIYIIDEVHMMTSSAFNALLLTLEEPPSHAVFIMATTNVESVPITILSRCQRFNFKKFSIDELKSQINYVCNEENIKIDEEACEEIAYLSEGGMRDALSLLDQLSSSEEAITVDKILANYGSISINFIKNIIESLDSGNVEELSNFFLELQNTSSDYKVFIKKLIQELAHVAIKIKMNQYQGNLTYRQVKNIIFELNECMNKININTNPFLLIEMILLDEISQGTSILKDVQEVKLASHDIPKEVSNVDKMKEKVDNEEEKLEIELDLEVNNEVVPVHDDKKLSRLKSIRVNNCFVNAKKEYLLNNQKIWNDLKQNFDIKPDLMALIVDSNIIASSDTHIILSTKLESTSNLINNKLNDLTIEVQRFLANDYKFICLTEEEWKNEKKIYVDKLKSGYKYVLILEDDVDEEVNQSQDKEEDFATNVFNRDKIEIV